MRKMYPKVLLVCGFNQKTANGITIANLFKQWPVNSIALLEYHSGIKDVFVPTINNYYLIGDKESKMVWPFNLIQKVRQSKQVNIDSLKIKTNNNCYVNSTNKQKESIFKLFSFLFWLKINFLRITGLVYISRKYYISKELNKWIKDFNPDIIYGTVEDIEKMHFLIELKEKYNKRLAIHVFDDWINSGHRYLFLKGFWNSLIRDKFNQLLKKSDYRLVISGKMAKEYSLKYNRTFYSFHNPIDELTWLHRNSVNYISNNLFTFIYAGKIGVDTAESIIVFIKEVEKINLNKKIVDFKIYSPYSIITIKQYLGNYMQYYKGSVEYNKLPEILASADGLLLPLSFSKQTISYIRLSMLTKVTEYLISGTPVFLYAPPNIAVSEYIKEYNLSFIHCKKAGLQESILQFMRNVEKHKEMAIKAQQHILDNYTIGKVQDRLLKILNDTL